MPPSRNLAAAPDAALRRCTYFPTLLLIAAPDARENLSPPPGAHPNFEILDTGAYAPAYSSFAPPGLAAPDADPCH